MQGSRNPGGFVDTVASAARRIEAPPRHVIENIIGGPEGRMDLHPMMEDGFMEDGPGGPLIDFLLSESRVSLSTLPLSSVTNLTMPMTMAVC